MKNKIFKFLSLKEKEKILAYILREKTKNGLTAEEEAQLICALKLKVQFHIRVFYSVYAYHYGKANRGGHTGYAGRYLARRCGGRAGSLPGRGNTFLSL